MERGVAVVRAAEFDHALADEHHRLPVQNAAAGPHPHRDPGVFETLQHVRIQRVSRVRARIDEQADGNARLPARQDGVEVAGILHEPERGVDALGFVFDQVKQNGAAVFNRGIAQSIVRGGGPGGHPAAEREHDGGNTKGTGSHRSCCPPPPAHKGERDASPTPAGTRAARPFRRSGSNPAAIAGEKRGVGRPARA